MVLRFNFANLQKSPSTVYVAGSMTDWKSVEMARCKGEKDFNLILDCSPGKYFYKFYVNNEWCIDDSQPISTYTMPKKSSSTKGKVTKLLGFTHIPYSHACSNLNALVHHIVLLLFRSHQIFL